MAVTLVALAAGAPAASAQGTAGELQAQVNALIDTTAAQWVALQRPDDVFQNPYPWDVAVGHPSYAPPMLTYALHRSGARSANPALVAAAERAWPRSVNPHRASAFDLVRSPGEGHRFPAKGDPHAQGTLELLKVAVVDAREQQGVRPLGGHSGLDVVSHVWKVRGER